jgi:hypothetical protein
VVILLDPEGYVIFQFNSWDERGAWMQANVPPGELWQRARCGDNFRVCWKLADLSCVQGFCFQEPEGIDMFYLNPRGG